MNPKPIFQVSAVMFAALALSACDPRPNTTQINTRLVSPDKSMEAIYAEDLSGGPMTGVSEDVYIVKPGNFPRIADRMFTNECIHDVELHWDDPKNLRVSYAVGADVHEDQKRDKADVRWFPWLWADSPSHSVQVRFDRRLLPGGTAC